jgi:hypothetical protein
MATKSNVDFREGIDIVFADGEKRKVRPLTIRQMRRFMKAVKDLGDFDGTTMDDDQIDKMIEAAAIALEKEYPDIAADKDALEDIIDMKSFGILMTAAMGADPND